MGAGGENGDGGRELTKEERREKRRQRKAARAVQDATQTVVKADKDAQKKKKRKRKDDAEEKPTAPAISSSAAPADNHATAAYRKKHNISLSPEPFAVTEKYNPFLSFSSCGLAPQFLTSVATFDEPTPVQAQAWPLALDGLDVVAIARTGSGKTIAFGVPGLVDATNRAAESGSTDVGQGSGPRVLVLAPTRELAVQISEVMETVSTGCGMSAVCLYGGVDKREQKRRLKAQQPEVVVATPGRLLDLLSEGAISLGRVSFFVLDEADRMLDAGFQRELREIASAVKAGSSNDRAVQTMMFSATWPDEVQNFASTFLRKGKTAQISIGGSGKRATANTSITQKVLVLNDGREKDSNLVRLLRGEAASVIVFALYKREVAALERRMAARSSEVGAVVSIHGDKSQSERSAALKAFSSGKARVLVATDVAARGLDLPGVDLVVNYTFPLTIEDYVHRIGRTGRAGRAGLSVTFFTEDEKVHAGGLVNVLQEAGQVVPEPLATRWPLITKRKEHALYGAFGPKEPITGTASKITFDSDSDD